MGSGQSLADRMRAHAGDEGHLYAHLMRAMADDWETGGPVRQICRGWEDSAPRSFVQLRLLAGLFRIALTGRAPALVAYYPCLGGTAPPANAWSAVREVMGDHLAELHEALDVAPQTNEVGRSTALLVGMFEAVRRSGLTRVRLLEPGASAGLNLLVDRFLFVNEGWVSGPASSPLVLAHGVIGAAQPRAYEIVERRGCDLAPVDASTAEGKLRLKSFVWPFHIDRHARLDAALEIAAAHPVRVDEAPAGQWLEERLLEPVDPGILTVVWQSITRLYWPAEEVERVAAAIKSAGAQLPLAHIAMEYPDDEGATSAELTVEMFGALASCSPMSQADRLATVGDHGTPVTLRSRS